MQSEQKEWPQGSDIGFLSLWLYALKQIPHSKIWSSSDPYITIKGY